MSAFHGPQPGVKDHGNKGALRTLREQKRREALIRQEKYNAEHTLLLTPAAVIQLEAALMLSAEGEAELANEQFQVPATPLEAPPKSRTRRKRTITRKHNA